MADATDTAGSYDSKTEAQTEDARSGENPYGSSYVKMWADALDRSSDEEKAWREQAEGAIEVYRGVSGKPGTQFNILHSNIETLCPALYNSTPAPDVRRRFADDDPVGKVVSQILERALSYSLDSYDFDATMKYMIRDGELPGRGVPRVRYEPTFGPLKGTDGQPILDANGQPQQEVVYEAVTCDYVPWKYFRRGPGRTWRDVPWVAFGDFLNKESLAELVKDNPFVKLDDVPLNYSADVKDHDKVASEEQSIFRRALVWQIWDRESRKVVSICTDYMDSALAVVDDPLELEQFYPIPRPYQPVVSTDSLTPITPYSLYEAQALLLNEISKRIDKLVKQLRPRGGYGGNVDDIQAIAEAGDGELVPLTGTEHLGANGGLDAWITWFPLADTSNTLNSLVQQREIVKASIYEITGVADILRGASNPTETATAQQIKSQWGSLRIQERQAEVARIARDLFRLKAEIIANKFSWETISQMTGIKLPSMEEKQAAAMAQQQYQALQAQYQQIAQQAQQQGMQPPPAPQPPQIDQDYISQPSREDVEQVMRSDLMRSYKVDVESDSTVRGDLTRNQQTMSEFLNATAQFASSMGPIVQQLPAAMPAVVEVYSSFARNFRLGKQAEDALSKLSELTKGAAEQAGQKQDPKVEAEKAKLDLERQKMEADIQLQRERMAADVQLQREKQAADERVTLEKHRMDTAHAMEKMKADQEFNLQSLDAKAKMANNPTNINFDANQAMGGVADHIRGIIETHGEQSKQHAEHARQNAELMGQAANAMAQMTEHLTKAAHMITAPKRVIRDERGKAIGVEAVLN